MTLWNTPSKSSALTSRNDDPFGRVFGDFDRIFQDLWRPAVLTSALRQTTPPTFTPNIDVREGDNEITVSAELPGLSENDVELNLEKELLTIRGEKKWEKEGGDKDRHYVESRYGAFTRTISLPYAIDQEKSEATFKNGVLKVRLPRDQAQKNGARKLPIRQ